MHSLASHLKSIAGYSKRRLLATLLPQDCVLCGAPEAVHRAGRSALLCADCRGALPYLSRPCCPLCALPAAGGSVCGRCLATPPHFDATRAALAYRYPFEPLMQRYKYRGAIAIAALCAELLHEAIARQETHGIDLVTVIPLSRERLVERGFNQALEIARPLARARKLSLRADLVHRVRHTEAQADLPFARRRKNIRGAFACVEDLSGFSIAVVGRRDDHRRHPGRIRAHPETPRRQAGGELGGGEDPAQIAAGRYNVRLLQSGAPASCSTSSSTNRKSRPTPATSSDCAPIPLPAASGVARGFHPGRSRTQAFGPGLSRTRAGDPARQLGGLPAALSRKADVCRHHARRRPL
ncbi:MAG: double zinc ribbon domain-containing protein [Rhodospirillales bacterium]